MRNRNVLFLSLLTLSVIAADARADIVSGRVVDTASNAVANCVISIEGLNLNGPVTAIDGTFTIIVPAGTHDIDFAPSGITFAPKRVYGVRVSGSINIGTVTLGAANVLSGSVTTTANAPVVGADINVYDQATGLKLFTPNDNTDALGQWQVTVEAGTYIVRARPPQTVVLVAIERENVVVTQSVNIGALVLPTGVQVTGTVVSAATSSPIAGVDIDVRDATTGNKIVTPFDDTDATGRFSTVVPTGLLHFAFDPTAGQSWLGQIQYNVYITAARDIGTIRLDSGNLVSGRVLGPSGPVARANLNVVPVPGRQDIYTPHDETDALGNFTIVVPSGSYVFEVIPRVSDTLAGLRSSTLTINQATTLPDFRVSTGISVTGNLKGWNNSPEIGASVSVRNSTGQPPVPQTESDSTGQYRFVVPSGTWDVSYHTKKSSFSRVETLTGVSITSARTLDHTLSLAPMICFLGTIGVPTVSPTGTVLMDLAFFNGSGKAVTSNISLVVVDPDGGEIVVLPKSPITLNHLDFAFLVALPFPLPKVQSKHLGRMFRYELRFDDPVTGAEYDHDGFEFIVR